MPNLNGFTSKILNEESGETVRDSIINAVNYISREGSNSSSLNGIPADKFAIAPDYERYKLELEKIIKFDAVEDLEADDGYAQTSVGVMTSWQMYEILRRYIRPSLKKIMNYEVDPEDNKLPKEATFDYLESFKIGKDSIFDALIAKGQDPDSATCFRDVVRLIQNIGEDNPVLVTQTLNEEKKYVLDKNEQGKSQAYSKVTVNVPNKTETGSGSENHTTYTPSKGKLFSSFRVNVNAKSQSASSRYGSGRGSSTAGGSTVDENNIMSELSVVENGDYIASESTVEGWGSVSVHVEAPQFSSGTTFTVTFKERADSSEVFGEAQVAPYGTARLDTTPAPPAANLVFAGWSPPPVRVIEDMTVTARFKVKTDPSDDEIQDDWPTILSNRGADYDKGSWKKWEIGTVNGHAYGTMIFRKVAEGEDGTTSTWVSDTVSTTGGNIGSNWASSSVRTFWNNTFFDDLPSIDYGPEFLTAIMPVRKKTLVYWGQDRYAMESTVEVETIDRIWVPSAAEMFGELPMSIMDKILKYYFNNQLPDGTYKDQDHSHGSWAAPNTFPEVEYGRFETRYTDYSGTYGGINYSTYYDSSQRLLPSLAPNNAGKYIKYLTSNNSTAEAYGLRTLRAYGYATGAYSPTYQGRWGVNSSGLPGSENGNVVPIGFCL